MSAILDWPRSPSQVERIQSERKRRAVELARRAPFFRDRLGGIDIDRLDDPDMWARIPPLTKDALRQIPPERFHDEFCVAPRAEVAGSGEAPEARALLGRRSLRPVQGITDFKAEVSNTESGLDVLRLFIEPRQGVDVDALQQGVRADVLKLFEVAAEITLLDRGTIGREFEASIKAARFVDRRG